jgi:hypothetical protein
MIPRIANLADQIVHGDKIAALCDVEINSPTLCRNVKELGTRNQIVFCKTDMLDDLFNYLYQYDDTDRTFVLITHNSDYLIDETRWETRPRCIKMWYAENAVIVRDRLRPVPLGVERPDGGGYSSDMVTLEAELTCCFTQTDRLAFMCHNVNNNRAQREQVTELLKDKSWATWRPHGMSFKEFCHNVHAHPFTICPEGNGPDTHRMWEALALGSIPIIKQSTFAEHWNDLPVLIVNSWTEVTEDYLKEMQERIQEREWDLSVMTMDYWKIEFDAARGNFL